VAYDVVVAGAGPVGLMLACELVPAGVRVLVVERLTEPDRTIKAGGINAATAAAFARRGLRPALAEAQRRSSEQMAAFSRQRSPDAPAATGMPRSAGHFGGILIDRDRVDWTDPAFTDSGPVASAAMVPQQEIEHILTERAAALAIESRRGVALTDLVADDDGVTVQVGEQRVRAGWLVGADGGRSTVRKLAGFHFPGTDPEITGYQAIVEIADPEQLQTGWTRTATGVYVHGPVPGRIVTIEFDGPPADREATVTLAELQASLRRVSGTNVTLTGIVSATRFTDNARQATTYRLGRVLLAGDAAHVHSPFGGQGLNLGIGDAVNLGWKLAATIQGWAPPGLLDTYTAERHPVGAWVLDWTRAQVAIMRPEPHARALGRIIGDLMATGPGATYFVKQISGSWHHYDLPGDHPLIGRSAPDLVLADSSRLSDHGHDGRALLLDLADQPELRALARHWGRRITVVSAGCPDRPDLAGMLIRPDGIVAWAADGSADLAAAEQALATWLGRAAA
jgi:2-polyprenyl-6-methoxyphenol hydroxylase-like FAD-dependent oxidoreductase